MIKKRFLWLPLLCLMLTACGAPAASAEPVELRVFAAASMQESLDSVIALYRDAEPEVTVLPTYDSSGTLLRFSSVTLYFCFVCFCPAHG